MFFLRKATKSARLIQISAYEKTENEDNNYRQYIQPSWVMHYWQTQHGVWCKRLPLCVTTLRHSLAYSISHAIHLDFQNMYCKILPNNICQEITSVMPHWGFLDKPCIARWWCPAGDKETMHHSNTSPETSHSCCLSRIILVQQLFIHTRDTDEELKTINFLGCWLH